MRMPLLIWGDDGEDGGFDIFGGSSFEGGPTAEPAPAVATVEPTAGYDPLAKELNGQSTLQGISYDPVSGELYGPDGTPLQTGQEQAIREAFGLGRNTFSQAQINEIASGVTSPGVTNAGEAGLAGTSGGGGASQQEVRDALQAVNAVNSGQPPPPGLADRLGKVLSDPKVEAKLAVLGGAAILSTLVGRLLGNPATVPDARKLAAQFQSLMTPAQNAFQGNLLNTFNAQAGPEQAVRSNALGQISKVMAGNWSNTALDEKAAADKETLANAAYQAGGADNLTQSTPWQRAAMYQNVGNQILHENDRRATLGQMLPVPGTFGAGLNTNLYGASGNPYGAQAGGLLSSLALQKYLQQYQQGQSTAKGAGDFINQSGQILLGGLNA